MPTNAAPLSSLTLPDRVTVQEATAVARRLVEALRSYSGATVVIDASPLVHFDSAALAVLLQCERQASAGGKGFSVSGMPAKLASLAALYGIATLLPTVGPVATT